MSNNTNISSFVVPLTHDVTTNQTALWDRLNKQPIMGNEHKYQSIMKILNNSRETINKCMLNVFVFIKNEIFFLFLIQMNVHCFHRLLN
jgi:hypothetical protein